MAKKFNLKIKNPDKCFKDFKKSMKEFNKNIDAAKLSKKELNSLFITYNKLEETKGDNTPKKNQQENIIQPVFEESPKSTDGKNNENLMPTTRSTNNKSHSCHHYGSPKDLNISDSSSHVTTLCDKLGKTKIVLLKILLL